MKRFIQLLLGLPLLLISACGTLRQSASHEFGDGIYRVRGPAGAPPGAVYAVFGVDSVTLYPLAGRRADTLHPVTFAVPESWAGGPPPVATFVRTSVDIDLTTILLKFRPATAGVPPQLNTTFNGALYAGLRRDFFSLRYRRTPIGRAVRDWTHVGFDAGPFAGIGATPVTPDLTRPAVPLEYDGVTLQGGLAAFAGLNSFTLGLTLGWEDLLDGNRKAWIYRRKPWVGLAIGLALN